MTDTHDERLMIRFLLDDLAGQERAALQDRAAADAEMFDSLCALEDELILKYHRGELTHADRQLFERAFSSPARQPRVASALAFLEAARAARARRRVKPFVWQRAREWLTLPWAVPGYAVATAVLLLAGGVPLALYGTLSPRVSSVDLGRAAGGARVIIVFELTAEDAQRAPTAGPRPALRVPADATDIRLDIAVTAPISAAGEVEVMLRRPEADAVATAGRLQLSGPLVLTLSVPAGELVDGDYVLTVRRRAADGPDLAAHAFRVSRE